MTERTRLYIGRISNRTSQAQIQTALEAYGPVDSVSLRSGYAFVEMANGRDAEDAVNAAAEGNGITVDDEKIIVEFGKERRQFDRDGARDKGRGGSCFVCGSASHWAQDCPDSAMSGLDVRSGKCFKCGESGHMVKDCRLDGGSGGGDRRRDHSPRRNYGSRDYDRYDDRRRGYSPPRGGYRDRGYDRRDDRDYRRRSPSPRRYRERSRSRSPAPRDSKPYRAASREVSRIDED